MLRRMNKFFSILLIICLVFSLIPPLPAKAAVSTIYLKVNSEWKTDNARFAAYFFNDSAGTNTWVSMTSKGNDYYSCSVPSGYPNVIFCRMTPSNTSNNWDNRWNQTGNLTVPSSTGSSVFFMSSGSWDSGSWGACGHPSHNTSANCTVCGTAVNHSWNSGAVTKAATCTATGVKTYTCTVCSGTKTETIAKIAHSYAAATCTKPQTCSCGATTGNALGHSWSSTTGKCTRSGCGVTCSHSYSSKVTAANCSAQGYTTYTCSTCKYSYTANYTSALGHNYVYKVTKNPTTSASGTLVGTCSRCSASTGNITIGKLGTTYHTYKVITAATCTTAGTGRYTWGITDYGTYYWDVSIPAKGHSYAAATCTKPQTCSCGATTGNALGHSYSSTVTKAATCTAAGVRTYTCSRCSDVYTEEIAATGHSYSGGKCGNCGDTKVVSVNGDFNSWSGANMTYSANGYTYSVTLAAATYKFKLIKDGTWLGNNGEIWDTTTATSSVGWEFVDWGDDCTLVATGGTYNFTFLYDTNMLIITYNHTHAYTAGTVVAPTCTAKGYTVYTCACGATENRDEKAALGHSYNSGVVTTAATCTTDGVKTFTCSRCDHSYTEAVAKLGHDYKATVTAPTCTAQGYTTHTCSRCSDSYKDTYKDALGHNYSYAVTTEPTTSASGTLTGTCSRCSSKPTETLPKLNTTDYSYTVTKAPGCTTTGTGKYTWKTTTYGSYSFNVTVPANGHSYGNASCSDPATCSVCGATTGSALGHSYTYAVTTEPTTSASGTLTGTCSRCSSKPTVTLPKLNTTDYSYTVTKAPGCTTSGTGKYTWNTTTYGSYSFNVTIPAKDHSYSSVVTAPTCTAEGYTTHTCANCGDTYRDAYTAALNHNYSAKVTTAATCESAGVKTFTCSRCSDVYTEEIAAIGHSYVGGKCGNCGDTKVVSVNGSFNDWAGANMTWTSDGYTYTIDLPAKTYEFKIVKDGAWMGNNGTIEDTTTKTSDIGWEFVAGDDYGNCTLIANGGTYTFTFNFDTNMLVIVNDHSHSYTAGEVVAPTCTAQGYTVYTCPCGDSYHGDIKAALEHSYSEEITTAPGCETTGVKTYTCSRCSDVYTEEIAATGHSYVGGKCGNCGDTKVVSINGDFNGWAGANMTYSANGYTYSVTLAAATYKFKLIKDGIWLGNNGEIWDTTTATSSVGWEFVAGDDYGDCTLVATGGTYNFTFLYDTNMLIITYNHTHAYTAGEAVAPTCTAKGYTVYTCACGDSYHGDEKAALDHSYTSAVTKTATCTEDGVRTYTCSRCSDSYTEVIAKLGHDYKATVTAPTCTAQGYTTHTCSRCSDSYKDTYKDALGHNYQNGACQNCGDSCEHKYTSKVTKEPTCTTEGVRTYTCSVCSGSYTEVIEKLGHSYSGVVTAPTCTAEGYTVYTCACGDSYKDDFVAALDHSYSEEITDATCENAGVKTYTCSKCGHSYTEEIAATGHSYVGGKCGNCGDTKVVSVNGSFNDWAGTNMTWTAGGYTCTMELSAGTYTFKVIKDGIWLGNNGTIEDATTKTSDIGWEFVAGDDYGDCTLVATGGTYSFTFNFDTNMLVIENNHTHVHTAGEVVEPTCTAEGYTVYTCACGDSYKDDFVAALDHSNSEEITTAPGCETTGVKTYTCSKCGHSYTEEIAATGHSYGEGVVTDPTCTAGGYTTYTCACGHSYTDSETAATGHKYVGGICENCGAAEVVDEYITVYFQNNWLWTDVYVYYWNANGYNAAFPGEAATFYANDGTYDIYCVTMPAGCSVIFSGTKDDGSGASDQTPDITGAQDGDCYWMTWADGNAVEKDNIQNVYCEHSYDEGVVTTAPGCESTGVKTYTCSKCGHSYTEEIAATGHSYGEGVVTDPTCTAGGYTTYTCACGHSYTDSETAATGHKYVGGICENCGAAEVVDEYITVYFQNNWLWTDVYVYYWNANGYNAAFPGEAATFYANDGTYDIYCVTMPAGCSVIFSGTKDDGSGASDQTPDITDAYDGACYSMVWDGDNEKNGVLVDDIENVMNKECEHSYTEEITTAATCTTAGVKTYSCSKCGHSYTEEIAATGHSYGEGVVTAPTCTAGGYTTYTCACGHSYTDSETAATGHKYVGGICENCGAAEVVDEYITVYFQNNWLWTDVYVYYWNANGYNAAFPGEAATFYANDGTYDIYCVTMPAGCSVIFSGTKNDDSGNTDQTPDITDAYDGACYSMVWDGDNEKNGVLVDDIENVMNKECEHSYTEEITTAATCTTAGVKTYSCSKCDHSYTEEIPALNHNYVDGTCANCGEAEPVVEYITVYFQNNWLWTDVYVYYWNANGYNAAFPGEAATFYANDGTYDIYCVTMPSDASVIFSGTKNDGSGASDQTPDITDAYDGACYSMVWDGDNEKNGVLVDDIENVMPSDCEHSYDAVITAPTCTVAGYTTYTCSKCDDSYTEEIAAPGHSYVNGVCSACGHAKDDNIKIHFVNTLGWQGVVAYAWRDIGGSTSALNGISWPGVIVQRDNDGYYTLEVEYVPANGESLGVLFHNFNGGQTADVLIDYATLSTSHEIWVKPATSTNSSGKYTCTVVAAENATTISPEVNGNQVTFRYSGSATAVYLAGSMNSWSSTATAMTKGADGVWSVTLTLDPGVYEYKFVVDGNWILDPLNGNVGGYDGNNTLVVPADDVTTNTGTITVVLHFYRANGDYSGWDVWYWGAEKSGAATFSADPDNKGMIATFTLDGNQNSNAGYTIRKSDWSDKEFYDRFIDLSDVVSGTVHYYVTSGVATGSRVLGEDVVAKGKLAYANYNYDNDTIWVKASLPLANPVAGNFSIVDGNNNATGITVTSATLEGNGYKLTLSKGLTLSQLNTYKVKFDNSYATISLSTHDLFYTSKFASEYTYYGDDLGVTWSRNSTTFKVWAPTAQNVFVKIYDSGNYGSGNQVKYVQMTAGDKGVWSVTVSGNWHGYYYNFDVVFPGYTVEATDPYARSTGLNGDRGMILNLDATDPAGWDNDISPNQGMSYTDAIIYEMHVREFTLDSNSGVNSAWRGKFLGLTQTGTTYNGHATGLDYLKEMGVTHVQLMPVFDFKSVDEYYGGGYSWGYDPQNYNVPEGSYSTNPGDGSVRVTEFKEMVQTFHENGINVVMDVVYNHAFDGGNFCYNKIVPNYFSRFYGEGNWSNGSGVGNDFATERTMARNYIVDSVLYWVEEYHIDGFRFDLAGLIDTTTINEIVNTVHAKYPHVIFYGEGWAAGDTAVEYGNSLATKGNAYQTPGFGYFNDDFRNAIAGNNGNSTGFASGNGYTTDSIANYFRAGNSWAQSPSQSINYVSAHDNYCLTDKLLISRNGAYWDEICKMNALSGALVLLSEGVPFLYSGDEMLRERKDSSGNRVENGYNAGDYANQINWADLTYKENADRTSNYYAGLIEFRKNHAALRCTSGSDAWNYVTYHKISDQTIMMYVSGYPNYECSDGIVIIFNASSSYVNVNLNNYGIPQGYWQATIHGTQAGVTPLWGVNVDGSSGTVGVEGISTTVLVLGDLIHEESVYNAQPSSCSHAKHNTSAMCTSCGKTVSHTYVNGSCSVCGLSQNAPATYTVYYDNSTTGWSNVNIYAWTTTAGQTQEYTGNWSGSAMTLIDEENGIYAYELPIGAQNIIFNGDGSQTENLTAPGYTSGATLYSDGSWIVYEGACDHSYTDSYIEEPTCIMDGVVKHTCDICGYSYTEDVEALGHDYVTEVTEPTCVNGGFTTYTCSRCSDSYVDDHVAALRHNYVDGVCDVCGTEKAYFLFGYINGANYGADGDEATMGIYKFVDGQLTVTFKENSYVGVKTIDNENWYMTDGYLGEEVTSATLYDTSVGINANKLFVPGQMKITFTLVENADGTLTLSYVAAACEHEYVSEITAPTCTEGGYTTHTCTYCGDSYTDSETEALGHNFADGFCDVCGAIDPAVCEHEYESEVTDPTCSEVGYTTYTCSICGHSYTDHEVEALGHSYEDVVTEPTCTEGGYTTHTCAVCGDSYTDSETEASGHNFVDGFCDACGAVDPATCEHEYESVVTDPTCTEGGYTTNTCPICGNVEITNETEAAGHDYVAEVTDPTCTEGGYTTHTCSVCGDSYTDSETEASGHSFVDGLCEHCGAIDPATCVHEYDEGVVTEPTCTEGGYTTYTCKLCGHSNVADETETVDHTYVDGICSVCGATDPAICEHEYESVVTDPTCTEGGYTTHTCSKCGDSYTDSETEATGHSFVNGTCEHCGATDGEVSDCEHDYVKTAATASCTEPGGDKFTCSKCGHYYFENATEALGHSYVDGICERCGNLKPLSTTYYLVGWINGSNHGCEEDGANMGNYPITSNMFKYTFNETSYVFLKTEGNGKWFMCDGYPGDGVCFANLYDTSLPIQHDKVNVPGGVEITFTLIERDDGSVTLTYVTAGNCSHNWYTQTQVWPGCTTTGVMLHRCIMCADSYTTTIPAKGHSYNGGSNCWDCGAANPNYTYYYQIVGWINGGNVGCEENWEQPGYQFSGNRLTMTFTEDSYIYIKTHDNSKWYMTDGYPGDDATSATFYHTDSYGEIQKDKMFVPKGRTITFTLSVRSDNTIYLSYVAASCQHTYDSWMNYEATCTSDGEKAYKCTKCDDYYTEVIKASGHSYSGTTCSKCGAVAPGQPQIYYLIGYINGADYGCNSDASNMGIYKFVDGQLVVTFSADSYVYIKTQGNTQWFMTQSFVETNTATFYDTATGAAEKMLVKAGTEYRFTLVENADGSLTLTYGPSNCSHSNTTEEVTAPTCTEGGYTTVICSDCGHREITNETEATGHSYVDGACEHCGAVDPATCQHVYGEGTVTAPTCTAKGYTTYTCTICGYEHIGDETEMASHDFVDGICSVCGAEEDDGMITVYFQNNWLWTDIYVYYWNDDGANAEFPGVPATFYANDGTYDIYCVTMPAGSKVIFSGTKNDGSGASDQTPDIEGAQDGDCYYMTWNDGNAVNRDTIDNILGDCEHEYESVVTEPGCKTPGYTTHTCSKCDDSYVDTHTAPVGHSFDENGNCECGESRIEEPQDFYLIGYINGANYGYEEDWENLGIYKFVGGKLVAHFKSDSYVFVKTGDNLGWYMASQFSGKDIPYAELFNTSTGTSEKLFVPGGMKITFVLVRTGDDSFILGYTASACEHPEHTITGKCEYCGEYVGHDYEIVTNAYSCTAEGGVVHTCDCGASYITNVVPAAGHIFVDGACKVCGVADESHCDHLYEMTVHNGYCHLGAYTVNTCELCSHSFYIYYDANADWTLVKPEFIHDDLLQTKPMYSYSDRETTTSDSDTLEGWTLIGAELVDPENGIYEYTFERWSDWSDWSDEVYTESENRRVQITTAYRNTDAVICEHDYVIVVADPTCEQMGYTTHTCSRCGVSYVCDYTDMLSHNYESVVIEPGCIEDGYTKHTCSNCGDSYITDEIPATGAHNVVYSFVDNKHTVTCTVCGLSTSVDGTNELKFRSINLALGSDITVNYKATVDACFTDVYVVFEVGPKQTFVYDYTIDPATGRYVFSYPGINPQLMGENISATLYGTLDGIEVSCNYAQYSVLQYCTTQLKKDTISAEFRTLLSDLLTYGSMVQILKDFETDSLLVDRVPEDCLLTPSTFPGTDALVNGQVVGNNELKNSTHDVASAALTLSNRVELRFGFKLDDPALYTYQVTIKGYAYTYTAEDLTYDETKDRYYLYFANCFASELGEPVTVVVLRDGVQVSRSLTYTANTYIKSHADAGDALADVLKALYNYGESARIYEASLQG